MSYSVRRQYFTLTGKSCKDRKRCWAIPWQGKLRDGVLIVLKLKGSFLIKGSEVADTWLFSDVTLCRMSSCQYLLFSHSWSCRGKRIKSALSKAKWNWSNWTIISRLPLHFHFWYFQTYGHQISSRKFTKYEHLIITSMAYQVWQGMVKQNYNICFI